MMRRHLKTVSGIIWGIIAALLMSLVPHNVAAAAGSAASIQAPEGMVRALENEALILYLNEEDTSVAVQDRQTGAIWYSNPPLAADDTIATPYNRRLLRSQIQIRYYNESVQPSVMDNYNDSILNGQFEIVNDGESLSIIYELGAARNTLLLPERISAERFASYLDLMDKSAARKVKRNYAEDGDNMVLRGGVKDYLKVELAGYFEAAGYTEEDLAADAAAAGESGEEEDTKARFWIPLTYRLDGNDLIAETDPDSITYTDEDYYLVDVTLLPYFGAVSTDEEGYLFVPDGCGALIDCNNGKTNVSSYAVSVYGQDLAGQVLSASASETENEYSVRLPVFGAKKGDQAWLAIIEEGAGYAGISADVSGRTSSYNNVCADFSFLQYGPTALSDMVGANSYQLYGERSFSEKYRLRYCLLQEGHADYAGMACAYREYLEKKGILRRLDKASEVPFYAELIGAIDRYDTFLGIRYRATKTLTTYADAEEIVSSLISGGVSGTKVLYTGWQSGGLHGTAQTKLRPLRKLENGGVSLKRFIQDMHSLNVTPYMSLELQYVYQDKWWDGYSVLSKAPGYFDHNVIIKPDYRLMDGRRMGKLADLISPVFAPSYAAKLLTGASAYGIEEISIGMAGSDLYSDYLEERYTDRPSAIHYYKQAFESCEADMSSVLSCNANDYCLGYVSDVTEAPLYSNSYQLTDREIPFYEMVLHGYMSYAGEAINLSDDYEKTILRSVESGAGLHFLWIAGDNALLKETDYDDLYSVEADTWLSKAAEDYRRLNDVLGDLSDVCITGHEFLTDVLVRVTYENGSVIYVNYGTEPAEADGTVIPARDFVRVG